MVNETENKIIDNDENEIHILDFFIVLAKHKKLIISITVFFIVLSVIYGYLKTPRYMAETRILPPTSSNSNKMGQLLNQLSLPGLVNFGNTTSGINNPDTLIEIFYSRPVIDIAENKIRGMQRYNDIDQKLLLKKLIENVTIEKDAAHSSQLLTVFAKDKDPKMAADLANILVEALNERLHELAVAKALQKRLFFDKELNQAKENLIKSEQEMIEFQEKTGILTVGGQINITINKFAPGLLLEYKRTLRQLKFDEKIFEIMLSQYKSAQLDELKDPSLIQVIEKAMPPKRFDRFILKKMMIAGTAAFLLSIFLAFLMEYIEKQKQNKESKSRIDVLKEHLSFKRKV